MADSKRSEQKEVYRKLPAKKNEYTCGNSNSRIYSENLQNLRMNQSQNLTSN